MEIITNFDDRKFLDEIKVKVIENDENISAVFDGVLLNIENESKGKKILLIRDHRRITSAVVILKNRLCLIKGNTESDEMVKIFNINYKDIIGPITKKNDGINIETSEFGTVFLNLSPQNKNQLIDIIEENSGISILGGKAGIIKNFNDDEHNFNERLSFLRENYIFGDNSILAFFYQGENKFFVVTLEGFCHLIYSNFANYISFESIETPIIQEVKNSDESLVKFKSIYKNMPNSGPWEYTVSTTGFEKVIAILKDNNIIITSSQSDGSGDVIKTISYAINRERYKKQPIKKEQTKEEQIKANEATIAEGIGLIILPGIAAYFMIGDLIEVSQGKGEFVIETFTGQYGGPLPLILSIIILLGCLALFFVGFIMVCGGLRRTQSSREKE